MPEPPWNRSPKNPACPPAASSVSPIPCCWSAPAPPNSPRRRTRSPRRPRRGTLIDIVTAAFTERGHTLENAEWDAWKDEKGFWVAQLQWQNGRSEIAAHWRYQPDAHGGSVSPLDDPAADLIDPDFGRALRGLATVLPPQDELEAPAPAEPVAEPRKETPAAPTARPATARQPQPTLDEYFEQRAVAAGGSAAAIPAASTGTATPAANTNTAPAASAKTAPAASAKTAPAASTNATPAASAPTTSAPAAAANTSAPAANTAPTEENTKAGNGKSAPAKPNRTKRGKAPMPSWEDVLLGVRSSGH